MKELDEIELFFYVFGFFERAQDVKNTIKTLKRNRAKLNYLPLFDNLKMFYDKCKLQHKQNAVNLMIRNYYKKGLLSHSIYKQTVNIWTAI